VGENLCMLLATRRAVASMSSNDNPLKPSRHTVGSKGGRGEHPDQQQQQQQEQHCKAISGAICIDGGLLFCHVCDQALYS
jgi:hypothetical protein